MRVSSTEFQNNVGKYLDLAAGQEIVITRNGKPVARLVGEDTAVSFLSDKLLGLLPVEVDLDTEKRGRLERQ